MVYTRPECVEIIAGEAYKLIIPFLVTTLAISLVAYIQILHRLKIRRISNSKRQRLHFAQAPVQIFFWLLANIFYSTNLRFLSENRLWKLSCAILPQVLAHFAERFAVFIDTVKSLQRGGCSVPNCIQKKSKLKTQYLLVFHLFK